MLVVIDTKWKSKRKEVISHAVRTEGKRSGPRRVCINHCFSCDCCDRHSCDLGPGNQQRVQ